MSKSNCLSILFLFISFHFFAQFSPEIVISNTLSYIKTFDAGDFDNDGDLDIVGCSYNSYQVKWFENTGNMTFSSGNNIYTFSNYITEIFAVDFDSDGDKDIIVGAEWPYFIENNGGGSFSAPVMINMESNSINLIIDFDNDGDMDIINTNVGIIWQENIGGGSFSAHPIIPNDGSSDVFAVDFDNDGDNDIVASTYTNNRISWYENTGNMTFGPGTVIASITNNNFSQLCAADMDADGDVDVLAANHAPENSNRLYKNNGNNTFTSVNLPHGGGSPFDIVVNDLNNDGKPDILLSNSDLNLVSWVQNLGNGVFGTGQFISNSIMGAERAKAFDFDGDGDNDILCSGPDEATLSVFENYKFFNSQVSGNIYIDLDQNGTFDTGDPGMNEIGIYSSPTSDYTFSYEDGSYFINLSDTAGNYTIFPGQLTDWALTSDSSSYHVNVGPGFTSLTERDFGFYPNAFNTHISPQLVGGFPRCNDTVNYWLSFSNKGTTISSGIVHLQLDDNIQYVSASITPDSISGQDIYWHYNNLFYFADELLNVRVILPDFASSGDYLTSYLDIFHFDADPIGSPSNTFSDTLIQTLVCAYDPNDKLNFPAGITELGYIGAGTSEIEYTIRFQNTGNDTAQNVVIMDQIDQDLDWTSINVLASSHDLHTSVDQSGAITFSFNGILLPDSNVNFLGSQGFVKYAVQLRNGLPALTEIKNKADIYFDFNPAVITNTTFNTIYDCNLPWTNLPASDTSLICKNEALVINGDMDSTFYHWSIPAIANDSGYNFEWLADTSGIFQVNIQAVNPYCSVDSVFHIKVPEITSTVLNALEICEGEDIMIFNQIRTQPGTYQEIVQNQYGCDSILYQELIVHTLPVVASGNLSSDTVCTQTGAIVLPAAIPAGGTWSGDNVSGNEFLAGMATSGEHTVYYTYTDPNNCSNSDSINVFVEDCLGIDSYFENSLVIYPNPFKENVIIAWSEGSTEPYSIALYNALGDDVYSETELTGTAELLLSQLVSGVYFMKVSTKAGKIIYHKLTKE